MKSATAEKGEWMSLREARARLGISPPVLRRLIDQGEVGERRIPGAMPRVKRGDIERLEAKHTRHSTAE